MGKLAALGYARMDARIAEVGLDNVVADVVTRIAEGEDPKVVAKGYGVPYVCLKGFLEEHAINVMGLARRAHADVLVHEALRAVDNATIEDVSLARLKSETKLKIAGKQSAEWGDKGQMGGGGGIGNITIVIGDVVKEVPPPPIAGEAEVIEI